MHAKPQNLLTRPVKNRKMPIIILLCTMALLFQGCLASPEKFQARLDKLSLVNTFSELRWPGGGYYQYFVSSKTDDPYIFAIKVINHPGGAYPDSDGDQYQLNLRYINPVQPSAIVIGSGNSCAITYTSAGTDGISKYDQGSSTWAPEESIQFLSDSYNDPFYDKAIITALVTKMNQTIAQASGRTPKPSTAATTAAGGSTAATTVTSEATAAYTHFDRWGLSFDYPREWEESPASEEAQMKSAVAAQLGTSGLDLLQLAGITGPNNEATILIMQYQTPTAMTQAEFIEQRNQVYAEAMQSGDVTKVNYVKGATVAGLPAVEEDVERSNGGRGLTCKIIDGRTVFEISFIVNDAAKFPQYSDAFSHILSTANLVIQ